MHDTHIFIIAGEASGDVLGAKLMRALKRKAEERNIRFSGIGGEQMVKEGLRSLFDMSELSMMGFVEVVPHIRHLLRRIETTAEIITDAKPGILVTIDSPGFTTRVVRKIREEFGSDMPIVHYVAPTVWAYKPKRAKKFAKLFNHLLVLLPFEPPYFEAEGLATTFVGHPVVEEPLAGDGKHFRMVYRIAEHAPVVTMLPGSRENEVARLLPVFYEALAILSRRIEGLTVVIPTTGALFTQIQEQVKDWPFHTIVVTGQEEKYGAYAASNAALAKSGTATLELSLARVPMVIAYKVHPVSAWIIRRMIKIPFANLLNILQNREIIPEFIQGKCTAKNLASTLENLLTDRNMAETQISACQDALKQLGKGEVEYPSDKAAEVILDML